MSKSVHFLGTCAREPLRNAKFQKKTCFARRQNLNLALRSGSLVAGTQNVQRPRSQSPLHFDIRNTWQIRSKYFPSTRLLLTNLFVFTRTNSMKCLVNWFPLRILVLEKYPTIP